MTLCGPLTSSTIPSDLVIYGGNANTGAPCTAAFQYTVGEVDFQTDVVFADRVQRYCRWCSGVAGSGNLNELYLKDFVPPTTATRKLKGVTVLSAITTGAANLAIDTTETYTPQEAVDVGGCGKNGQTTKINTKGQLVEFTITLPAALAEKQFVIWEEVTGTPVGW